MIGVGLGFAGGIYLSRRGGFTRSRRTVVIFASAVTGEMVARKVAMLASMDEFEPLFPQSPIHHMTPIHIWNSLEHNLKSSNLRGISEIYTTVNGPSSELETQGTQGNVTIFSMDGDNDTEKPVKKNQYGDIIE